MLKLSIGRRWIDSGEPCSIVAAAGANDNRDLTMAKDLAGDHFLGFPVRELAGLAAEEVDCVILATFERPEPHVAELTGLGLPPEKVLTLRQMALPAPASGAAR